MGDPVALAPLGAAAGLLGATLAVAAAWLAPSIRARAVAMLLALALAPGALAWELYRGGRLAGVAVSAPLAVAALVGGLVAVTVVAVVLLRAPGALPVLTIAALPFRIPVAVGGQSASLLVPLYLVVAGGCLAHALRTFRGTDRVAARLQDAQPGRTEVALLIAIVLYAAQALYSTDFTRALENAVFFYVPFALLLKLLGQVDWTPQVTLACLSVAVALALAFVAVGFWEYATGRLLLNPKVIASNQFESYFRVNSLFFDPNIYGRFLAVVMLAVCGVVLWARSARGVLLAAATLAVLWTGLVLTFSQSSFAALLAGLAVLGGLRWRWRPVAVVAGLTALAATAVVLAFPGLVGLDLGSSRSLDSATSGRLGLMRGGLTMWVDRPLTGYGSGAFEERFREREEVTSQTAAAASHTIPITVAAEQGAVGLVSYGLVLAAACGLLFGDLGALARRAPPPLAVVARAVVGAAFIGLVVHTLLYAAFLEDPIAWTLLGAARGLRRNGAGLRAWARTRTGSSSPSRRYAGRPR